VTLGQRADFSSILGLCGGRAVGTRAGAPCGSCRPHTGAGGCDLKEAAARGGVSCGAGEKREEGGAGGRSRSVLPIAPIPCPSVLLGEKRQRSWG